MPTVMITGAGRGLGRALATAFEDAGYHLILNCFRSIPKGHLGQNAIKGDIRQDKIRLALRNVAKERGLDVLINNAGVYVDGVFPDVCDRKIREMIDTNLIAPILLTRILWPIFQEQRSGVVVNINSIAGKVGSEGEAVYCASKFGLRGFSESLQYEATKYNIQVIDVSLGAMNTDMTFHREDQDKLIDPHDAASTILKLCESPKSMRITGIDIKRMQYE